MVAATLLDTCNIAEQRVESLSAIYGCPEAYLAGQVRHPNPLQGRSIHLDISYDIMQRPLPDTIRVHTLHTQPNTRKIYWDKSDPDHIDNWRTFTFTEFSILNTMIDRSKLSKYNNISMREEHLVEHTNRQLPKEYNIDAKDLPGILEMLNKVVFNTHPGRNKSDYKRFNELQTGFIFFTKALVLPGTLQ